MSKRLQKILLATTALVPLGLAPAAANPLGAQVVGGSASVQGQGTANVTVRQSTDRAIINWNTFNIDANEKTQFIQPKSSSIALNRVTGGLGPSQLFGSLSANGRVFVVNPDGILVGPGAKIDTAGFLATTHNIANTDFMAGRYSFSIPGRPDASVVNQGTITAQNGGFAALVAPGVRNSGTITARLGKIALASGNGFSLDFYGDKLITLGISDSIAAQVKDVATGQRLSALVSNEGKLKANGGTVELTAVAAREIVDSVINNRGVIEANSIGRRNGMIVLGAATSRSKPAGAPTQTVKVSGKLSATGKRKGTTGGTVEVTGEAIALAGATIDASGRTGGGTVSIGGDVGGGNPNPAVGGLVKAQLQPWVVPTATTVSVDSATTINASAKDTGDGGKVVVWADGSTTFNGSISARGGAQSGNGGFVETSGHQKLNFSGAVDLRASHGAKGTLLLDPEDVTIEGPSSTTTADTSANGNGTTLTGNIDSSVISTNDLINALYLGNVTIMTGTGGNQNGDITVAAPIAWGNTSTLTLSAYRNIAVNAQINGLGDVNLRADNTGTGIGTVTFGNNGSVVNAATVSIFFNPSVNPAGSGVNSTSYTNSTENFRNNVSSAILRTYMLVNTIYDLQNIQNEPTLFGSGQEASLYALGRNIDASATATWNNGAGFIPIGTNSVDVIFNGQAHTIDRLTISSSQSLVGLFGSLSLPSFHNDGISNLGLTNVNITATAANSTVGALVGRSRGIITNVYVTGSVTASGTGSVVGGLVGSISQDATITGSHSNAVVSGGDSTQVGEAPNNFPFPAFSPTTAGAVGGLVGSNVGLISNSYATGPVSGGSNNNIGGLIGFNAGGAFRTYATGSVTGGTGSAVGGLVGYNDAFHGISFGGTTGIFEGDVQQSFASGSVSAGPDGYAGGLVGINHGIICNNCFFPVVVGYIDQSYSISSVSGGSNGLIGGLVGLNEGTVLESYAIGLISGDLSSVHGGLIGQDNHQIFGGTFSSNYWDIQTSGLQTDGALSGSTGLQTADLKTALSNGFDPTVWALSTNLNSGYPYLVSNLPPALTPPTPPTPPTPTPTPLSLPAGTTDIFGTMQTASFTTTSINTQTAALRQGVTSQPDSISVSTILNSAGFNYLTAPALGEILDRLLLNVPLQYLSQSESEALSKQISTLLQNELKDAPLTGGAAGLELTGYVGGLVVDLIANYVHDSMAGKYPAVLVELYKFEIEVAGNSAVATVISGGNLPLGVAQGVIQASTAEVIDTAKTWYLWHDDSTAMLAQADKLQSLVDKTHTAAEQAKANGNSPTYERLMKVAIGLQGAVGMLRESALSPVSDRGTTLNAIWQSLWNR